MSRRSIYVEDPISVITPVPRLHWHSNEDNYGLARLAAETNNAARSRN